MRGYALDVEKLRLDLKATEITIEYFNYITGLYKWLIDFDISGQLAARQSCHDTLELSGYYGDVETIKRTKTIKEIIA